VERYAAVANVRREHGVANGTLLEDWALNGQRHNLRTVAIGLKAISKDMGGLRSLRSVAKIPFVLMKQMNMMKLDG